MYQHIKVPAQGQKITVNADMSLNVPDQPIIPYIEGDGTGFDITPVMLKVVDAAVDKAYGGTRKIHWMEVYAGEKATRVYGPDVWLPDETLRALREYVVSIKGPLTTPVGGGIRSLNVALRQELDLYVCLRPVQYFKGVPSPLKEPEGESGLAAARNIQVRALSNDAPVRYRDPTSGEWREEAPSFGHLAALLRFYAYRPESASMLPLVGCSSPSRRSRWANPAAPMRRPPMSAWPISAWRMSRRRSLRTPMRTTSRWRVMSPRTVAR